jgi:hypothetical protein
MKYGDVFNVAEPKLQLGQVVGTEQNGRVHSLQARLVMPDGTVAKEGTIKTFMPLDEIELADDKGFVDTKINRLSSNGKWLVKVGVDTGLNDFEGLAIK